MPPRVLLLWLLLLPPAGGLGIVAASWIVAMTVAINQRGFEGMHHLRVSWGIAHAPTWIDEASTAYERIELASVVLGFPLAIGFGMIAGRLWRFLVVDKLRWMTQAEVDKLRKNERQYM